MGTRPLRIAFLHPDLGIGGAERLVIDMALALRDHGHDVTLYTSHYDCRHCFLETRTLHIVSYGDWMPRELCGKAKLVAAAARNLYAATRIAIKTLTHNKYDVIIVDQLTVSIPLLKMATGSKILYYCHFPDLLLSKRTSIMKRLYRVPLDAMEQITTAFADRVFVNSKYTKEVFLRTFPAFKKFKSLNPEVLYPAINVKTYDRLTKLSVVDEALNKLPSKTMLFISFNRYERKKNIELAIHALHCMDSSLPIDISKQVRLIIAGGHDPLNRENKEYYQELKGICKALEISFSEYPDVTGRVIFLRNFTDNQKVELLKRCLALIYTPDNEHFGIVPIEAMCASRAVIAANSGGPMESIVHGVTGLLCKNTAQDFGEAMSNLAQNSKNAHQMGIAGRQRVLNIFSDRQFTQSIGNAVIELADRSTEKMDLIRTFATSFLLMLLPLFVLFYKNGIQYF